MWHTLLVGFVMTGLSCSFEYRGDGNFVDRGASAAVDQYVLDLGEVRPGPNEFLIGKLPETEFVVGFHVAGLPPDHAQADSADIGEPVDIELLVEPSSHLILHHSRPLRDWVWTCGVGGCEHGFAYLREEGGAGTYFVPRKKQRYRVRVQIPSAELFTAHQVNLVVRGGGWK